MVFETTLVFYLYIPIAIITMLHITLYIRCLTKYCSIINRIIFYMVQYYYIVIPCWIYAFSPLLPQNYLRINTYQTCTYLPDKKTIFLLHVQKKKKLSRILYYYYQYHHHNLHHRCHRPYYLQKFCAVVCPFTRWCQQYYIILYYIICTHFIYGYVQYWI